LGTVGGKRAWSVLFGSGKEGWGPLDSPTWPGVKDGKKFEKKEKVLWLQVGGSIPSVVNYRCNGAFWWSGGNRLKWGTYVEGGSY